MKHKQVVAPEDVSGSVTFVFTSYSAARWVNLGRLDATQYSFLSGYQF